jgi:uncharacterized protein (DUF427 family)
MERPRSVARHEIGVSETMSRRFDGTARSDEMETSGGGRAGRVRVEQEAKRVRVEVDGVVLAESTNARVLYEAGLPPRWYIPRTDLRMDLLVPTATVTHCPYKGQARYWSVRAGDHLVEDLAWSYPTPLPESQRIAGLVAFYNEEVDLFLDDQLQERPVSKFSRRSSKLRAGDV